MTAMISAAFPSRRGAAYKACELLTAQGPRTVEQLLVAIDFGSKGTQKTKLLAAIDAGWIYETPAGMVDVTEPVKQHFAALAPKEKSAAAGQVVEPQYRGDWRGSTLSRQHIPNRRGPRADVPAWSVRETVSIKTIGGREA